jgi:hypothetical protein
LFHGLDEGLSNMANKQAAGRLGLCVELERLAQPEHDLLVTACLLEVLRPLFLQVVVLDAAQCRLVDLDAALLGFQCLIEKLTHLFSLHELSPYILQA